MSHLKKTEFRKIRERCGLSIQVAADLFGVNPRTIHNWDKRASLVFVLERRAVKVRRGFNGGDPSEPPISSPSGSSGLSWRF
jgi:hypothetical protein